MAQLDGQPQPTLIEALDAPAAAAERRHVLARLAEREQQRAAAAAKRLQELQVTADPRESVEAFLASFSVQRQELDAALASASAAEPGSDSSAQLAVLAEQLADLEQAVAEASYYLPAYDLRQATLALATLRERQEAAAAAAQPRRRFAFSRKAPAPAPAAVADAAAGQRPAASHAAGGQQPPAAQQQQQQKQQQQQQQDASVAETRPHDGAISGLRGAVVALARGEAQGREFTLSDLEDCAVYLLAPLAALFLHRLRRCRVYTGPVAGACLVEGAADCVLMLAARQVRIHSAADTDVYLRVRSHPVIEHSQRLRFAPYSPAYAAADRDLAAAGLSDDGAELWAVVHDFGWLRATPSPHWRLLPEPERAAAPAGPPRADGVADAAAAH